MAGSSKIQFDCPQCLAAISIPTDQGGQRIECPSCKRSLLAPDALSGANSIFDDLFDAESPDATEAVEIPESATSSSSQLKELEPEDLLAPSPKTVEKSASETQPKDADDSDEIVLSTLDLIHDEQDEPEPEPKTAKDQSSKTVSQKGDGVDLDGDFQLAPIDDSIFDNVEDVIQEHRDSGESDEKVNELAPDELELEDPAVDADEITIKSVPTMSTRVESGEPEPPPAQKLDTEDDFSLEDHLHVPELEIPETNQDPFAVDPDKPLRVDGISPTVKSSEIYGVKCNICDTRLHVTLDQAGETVECPECFSPVVVSKPSNEKLADLEKQEDEYRLAAPEAIERPHAPIPDGHGLGVETRDLLAPAYETDGDEVADGRVDLLGSAESESSYFHSPGSSSATSTTSRSKPKKVVEPEYGTKSYWEAKVKEVDVEENEVPEILRKETLTPVDYVSWLGQSLSAPDAVVRALVTIAMLGLMYWMASIFHATTQNEEATNVQKIMGTFIPAGVGGVAFILGAIGLFTTCSMVFQNSASGLSRREEWPGFSVSDWLGPISFFMFSFWLGSLPGGFLGLLLSMIFELRILILIGSTFSAFMLTPLLLMSACYNGSPFQVFAKDIVSSFKTDDVSWLMYVPFCFAIWLGFTFGTLILILPTIIFATLGAGIQVIAMLVFAAFTGLFVARYVSKVQELNKRRR